MVLKNLWRRKLRTLLTMLGVAIGVAAVVALTAFGEGIAGGLQQISGSSAADLTVAQKEAVMLVMSAVDDDIGAQIQQIHGVDEVIGTVVGIVQLQDSPYFLAMGEDPKGFAIDHYKLVEGDPITGKRQILLGKLTAKNFKKLVGDRFQISELPYNVVGIYETGVSFEDGGAVLPLAEAKLAFGKRNEVSYFSIKTHSPDHIDAIKEEIETRWPDLAATRSGETNTRTERLNIYRSFGWFLGIFAALVGGLGMTNTVLMSVFERTREIGVLRAVGWRRRRIMGMIMGESMVLALGGGALGLGLGYGLTQLARLSPTTETLLASRFTPQLLVQMLVMALVLGLIGGAYPAWRASRMLPIEAMRRESGSESEAGPVLRFIQRIFGRGPFRNLLRRPTRTLVTIAGIGIGVGFIFALVIVTDGMAALFNQLGTAGQVDLMVAQAKASDSAFSVIDERVADKLKLRSDVRSVSKLLFGLSTAPGVPYFLIFGIDPHDEYIQHYRVVDGRLPEFQNEIIIGRYIAQSVKREVGDKLTIAGSQYRIVGIYENGVAFEDTAAVMSLRDAQKLFRKPRQLSFLGINVVDPNRADEVALTLEWEYPELMVSKVANFSERMNDFTTMRAMLDAVTWVTMIVGGVVMMNAMLMSVFERTHEIGVLRALGWRKWRVVGMVVLEALALSVLSALAGLLMGAGLAELFKFEPTYGAYIAPLYSTETIVWLMGLTGALGLLGALYPALHAANLAPIEALRYE